MNFSDQDESWPVRLVMVQGAEGYHKRKLVASRDIAVGEVVLKEHPLLSIFDGPRLSADFVASFWLRSDWPFTPTAVPQANSNLYDYGALYHLSVAHPERLSDTAWMDRFAIDQVQSEYERFEHSVMAANLFPGNLELQAAARRFLRVLGSNSFVATNRLSLRQFGLAFYHWASYINHSCEPNTQWNIGPQFQIFMRAISPISAGAEVVTSYSGIGALLDPDCHKDGPVRFGTCLCTRCSRPASENLCEPRSRTVARKFDANMAAFRAGKEPMSYAANVAGILDHGCLDETATQYPVHTCLLAHAVFTRLFVERMPLPDEFARCLLGLGRLLSSAIAKSSGSSVSYIAILLSELRCVYDLMRLLLLRSQGRQWIPLLTPLRDRVAESICSGDKEAAVAIIQQALEHVGH
jgi:hypothetical protein